VTGRSEQESSNTAGAPGVARPPGPPPLRRRRGGRLVAGVCGGIADHLGVPVLWVRLAFAVLAALEGAGVVAYALLWMFVRQGTDTKRLSAREQQQGIGLILLSFGLMLLVGAFFALPFWLTSPFLIALLGAAVVWREADESQRRQWREEARTGVTGVLLGGGVRAAVIRVLCGTGLMIFGIVAFLSGSVPVDDLPVVLFAVLVTLIGFAVMTVPWWLRLVGDLNAERANRIRSQERAEIAAHLHDSVLQTLALIQKQADSAREVRRLARGQERELRSWLYGGENRGSGGKELTGEPGEPQQRRLSAELARICGEVEDAFAIKVQQVVVGDCELDDRLTAQLAAAREAIVNAAKHAGVDEVSVYAEAEPEQVAVFVRDRGVGFDPEDVPADRHGLADSVRGRMHRHGGAVKLRTKPGAGTEVQLVMPRKRAA
jgi:signal transduction histidine kinase